MAKENLAGQYSQIRNKYSCIESRLSRSQTSVLHNFCPPPSTLTPSLTLALLYFFLSLSGSHLSSFSPLSPPSFSLSSCSSSSSSLFSSFLPLCRNEATQIEGEKQVLNSLIHCHPLNPQTHSPPPQLSFQTSSRYNLDKEPVVVPSLPRVQRVNREGKRLYHSTLLKNHAKAFLF